MGKTLEKGTWVRWMNNNQLNIGRVVDEPTKKPDGRLIYPIITMDGGKTAVGGDKIEKIPHMKKVGKLSPKKKREFEDEIKNYAANKLHNQQGNIEEALKISQANVERLKKLNAELEERIKTVENEREMLANQVSQFNKSEIIDNIKQAVEQCLSENPENRLSHVQYLLNCMYKIAGI